ncbi:MAG: hypothetical protein KC800_16485 [Candidatus Eremiobacteraeota bacterium]|nr:hypothetical protein [Candidatus Eremiobacteraeota bacterium]
MSSLGEVQYRRKPWLPTPWREYSEAVAESQVAKTLSDGVDLVVKGPDQSAFIPLRTAQDFEEFQSFSSPVISSKIQDPQLAANLKEFAQEGAKFVATLNESREEVGPYGAYNALTGELGIKALEIVFAQPLPSVVVPDKVKFEDLIGRTKLADEMTAQSRPEYKARHWNLLFQAALQQPGVTSQTSLTRSAARLLNKEDWNHVGPDLGVVGELYKNFEGPRAKHDLISDLAGQVDTLGYKRFRLQSVVALNEAALQPGLNDRDYFRQVMSDCAPIDKGFLGTGLAEKLFPKELEYVEDLTKFGTDHTYTRKDVQSHLLEVVLDNPKLKEPSELLKLTNERIGVDRSHGLYSNELHFALAKRFADERPMAKLALSLVHREEPTDRGLHSSSSIQGVLAAGLKPGIKQEEFVRQALESVTEADLPFLREALVKTLRPEASELIQNSLAYCSQEDRAEARNWMNEACLLNPKISSEKDLLLGVASVAEESPESDRVLNEIYESLLERHAKEDKNAQVALSVLQADRPRDLRLLKNPQTIRAVSEVFLDSDKTPEQLIKSALRLAHPDDGGLLRQALMRQLFPETAQNIDAMTAFSSVDDKLEHWSLLSATALRDLEVSDPEKIAAETIQRLKDDSVKDSLVRVAAKHRSQIDKRARALTRLADEHEDGDPRVQDESASTLYRLALKGGLTNVEVMRKAVQGAEEVDQTHVRGALAEELFPEIVERLDEIVTFSAPDAQGLHRDYLLRVALDQPEMTEVGRLVEAATRFFDSEELEEANLLRETGLKRLASKSPIARKALDCVESPDGKFLLKSEQSVEVVYKAGLDAGLTPKSFFLQVVSKAEEEDKATLTGLLGGELLRAPGLDVPAEFLESFEKGELSAQEVIEIVEALETQKKDPNTNIEVEEDRIIIGDQQLEVDL